MKNLGDERRDDRRVGVQEYPVLCVEERKSPAMPVLIPMDERLALAELGRLLERPARPVSYDKGARAREQPSSPLNEARIGSPQASISGHSTDSGWRATAHRRKPMPMSVALAQVLMLLHLSDVMTAVWGQPPARAPKFEPTVIDARVESNAHKAKVLARFSESGPSDLGSLDKAGFKIYRSTENWKAYTIFEPGDPGGFEDAAVADINGDGARDIVLGGWSNRTIWAENPTSKGQDPYKTRWSVHEVDTGRFSHEVCAVDLNHDGKCDIVTTSGVYLQGTAPDAWTFVDIGRSGQGTCAGKVFANDDGFRDVVALVSRDGKNQVAWFENPSHGGGQPAKAPWTVHVIDPNPGGDRANRDMTCMAFVLGDLNGDGRPDLIAASQGEGPDRADDPRQVGDGLIWYEASANLRTGQWIKHSIDPGVGWVHASSIQPADFDGDGDLDLCYAEQDQSRSRKDGIPGRRIGIFYNLKGDGRTWRHMVLGRFPEHTAGGFNSKVGIIGNDRLPSIFTSLHGFFGDANPLILWRNRGASR
jgi:hypothetical protein